MNVCTSPKFVTKRWLSKALRELCMSFQIAVGDESQGSLARSIADANV